MPKIVVIDDEGGVCDMLREFFEPEGYTVRTETDPVRGIELVKKERPDCVLLDIKMPKADGIKVLSAIKAFDKEIGVIMISGHGNIENAEESFEFDAFDYVTKPLDLELVRNLVKHYLEGKKK